eukprot:14666424-Heterocapsa_arctica.AAC.1
MLPSALVRVALAVCPGHFLQPDLFQPFYCVRRQEHPFCPTVDNVRWNNDVRFEGPSWDGQDDSREAPPGVQRFARDRPRDCGSDSLPEVSWGVCELRA